MSEIKAGISNFLDSAADIYPNELVVTVKDGELSINQPEPYIIPMPELFREESEDAEDQIPVNMVVFDSNGTLDDLDKYSTLALINKTNLLVRESKGINIYPLKDFPDGELSEEDIQEGLDALTPIAKALPYIIYVFGLFAAMFYYFGVRLVYLAFVAFALFIIGSIRKMGLNFSKYYQIAVHAITLPLIIELLIGAFNLPITLPAWFFTLNLLIGIFALFNIDSSQTESSVAEQPQQ